MPTALSHPAVPLAIGLGAGRAAVPGPLLAVGVAASVLPDLDVIAFRLGVPYGAGFGHRGFSHSLAFAALVALVGGACHQMLRARFSTVFGSLFAATASHGVLDAFTTGGLGVAFFWPLSLERYFAPVRVIRVAPLRVGRLLSGRGVAVLLSEALWVWLPCAALATALALARRRGGASVSGAARGPGSTS